MRQLKPVIAAFALALAACSGGEEGTPDGGQDAGPQGPDVEVCGNTLATPAGGAACAVTDGDARVLIEGDVIMPGGVKSKGGVLIGLDGKIACAGCGCAAQAEGATKISCPGAAVSPGLINAHDHITFTGLAPKPHTERYEQRHDWRKGKRGHTKISSPSTPSAVAWGELRQAIAGTTSLIGSGGEKGLLRNLDGSADLQEGLGRTPVKYSTFPLGDQDGQQIANGCAYPKVDDPAGTAIAKAPAYVPHVAEGIDDEAHNEFNCVSGQAGSARDLVIAKAAFIHAVGLKPTNYAAMATDGTALIWSPRSNIDLYGNTAEVTTASRVGVEIALGTDWTASGSMNTLRELRCADGLNQNQYAGFFTDRQLIDMATINAARVAAVDDVLGSLEVGKYADVAVFAGGRSSAYRAILGAEPKDVLLVVRGGKALFGEAGAVDAVGADGCEATDVCGSARKICVKRETGKTLAELKGSSNNAYDLYFCGAPKDEPSCVPMRPNEFAGVSTADDKDGDGVKNDKDDCPDVFNPVRPLDGEKQSDVDGDGKGDACDPCATSADDASCPKPVADDADLDGVRDATDNCRSTANAGQEDRDQDGTGDVCDACPDVKNAAGEPCPATIYQLKEDKLSATVSVPEALVTAVTSAGFFMQHTAGDASFDGVENSGIFVYLGRTAVKPAMGDRVTVKGTSSEYFGESQLSTATFVVKSQNNPLPEPVLVTPAEVATGGAKAEALEAVLVKVESVKVSNVAPEPDDSDTPPTNEFQLEGGLLVNDYMYLVAPAPELNETFRSITGVLRFGNNNSKIEPRAETDVVRKLALSSITAASAYVAVGAKVAVTVKMNSAVPADTLVTLVSSNPAGLAVPQNVTVPKDAATVTFEASALLAATEAAVITATYETVSKTASARPYDPAGPRVFEAFTSDVATLAPPAQVATLTAKLDLPAGPGGAEITITADPADLATLSADKITIAEGAFAGTVTATWKAAGSLTVSAKLGDVTKTAAITLVAEAPAGPPGAGDLVVTEVMVNPKLSGSDEAHEWFEVMNASTHAVILNGLVLEDNAKKVTVAATPELKIDPGAYATFACKASAADSGGVTPTYAYGTAAGCQLVFSNGGDFIRLSVGEVEVDKVTWGTGAHPALEARSICLKFPYGDNSVKTSWGDTPTTVKYGTDNAGSPGVASTADNCK